MRVFKPLMRAEPQARAVIEWDLFYLTLHVSPQPTRQRPRPCNRWQWMTHTPVTTLQQTQPQNLQPSGVGSGVLRKTQCYTLPCLQSTWQKLPGE